MSWALYDDALPHNRKVAWLRAHGTPGIAALGLHLLLNTWCRHEGMQGFVPAYIPEQQAGKQWRKLISLLADDGCGMLVAVDGGWMINDYDQYGKDGGVSAREKQERLSKVRAEAGRAGGLAKAAKSASKRASKPVAEPQQTSSPTPIPRNSPTSIGSRNVQPGSLPQVIRAYVESAQACGMPFPEASQDKVQRSAARLLDEGYPLPDVIDAAKNAAIGGWTDLAVQLQRDAARASPAATGPQGSTTDQRVNSSIAAGAAVAAELAALDQPERRALA